MGKNLIETLMGAVVLIVAAVFAVFAYQNSNVKPAGGYSVAAKFENASGISVGSEVRVGGIKIGVVSDMTLDPQSYEARVTMTLKRDARIPKDSSALIVGDGLLGSKYVAIEPGADDAMLEANGEIQFTQSSVNLETLIGKFMFSGGGVDGKKDGKPAATAAESSAPAAPAAENNGAAAPDAPQ